MDVRPPQSVDESFTIAQAKWLNKFSNLVGTVVGAIALLDQSGAFALLPAKLQRYVTPVALTTGVVALLAGQKKQGAALIANHSGRPYVYTPEGVPGRDQKDALNQVFMPAAEVAIARKAVAGELIPVNVAQKREQLEEKIFEKLDQLIPLTSNLAEGVARPPVDMGVTSHFAPNPLPTPSPGLLRTLYADTKTDGASGGSKISLSDLAVIAQEQN
jgi:hypothetical protein